MTAARARRGARTPPASYTARARPGPRPIFLFNDRATPELYTLSLHDALPISRPLGGVGVIDKPLGMCSRVGFLHDAEHMRSEEHTSELQSPVHLVCRLLLEKKKLERASGAGTRRVLPRRLAPPGGGVGVAKQL